MSFKAFELVPAIERVCWGEKVRTVIECLECCGKHLYVGTRESFIIYYTIEEKCNPNGNVVFTTSKKTQSYLENAKPVALLKAVSALNRILLLLDGNLLILNMFTLETIPSMSKLKGITYFCLNENPESSNPFSVEICVAKKRQLQIYHVTDDKVLHQRDIPVPDMPVLMAMDGLYICAALSSRYVIINSENGYRQELFPREEGNPLLVKRITKEEFLLGGPGGLGMFVTSAGISERPPLSWGESVISVAYMHPYLAVLSSESLAIYSILDQQIKQRIPFLGGRCLGNFDGKLYVTSADIVCALLPVPWQKQVEALLNDKKVTEALELAHYSNKAGLSKEQSKKILQRIQQQAGFIEFSLFHFDEARDLFHEGQLDVRELISLYPRLMPSNSSFARMNPPVHNIANVHEMCSAMPHKLSSCYEFLQSYLEEVRSTPEATGCKLEVDTALLKIYAEQNTPYLLDFVNSVDLGCNPKEGVEYLMHHQRYHALAIFHSKLGENDKAVLVWSKLVSEEFKDPTFPGLPFLIEFLCKLNDHALVWKYADFVLERDQELGVKIFTDRDDPVPSERMRPELITEYLHRFPKAIIRYLEHVVYEKKLEKEKFHTHLAILYLDNVLQILKLPEHEQSGLRDARKKLQHLLHFSKLYRVQLLLGKALECQLHAECAILYGRLEEHEKALRILIHKLQDHTAAEDYCIRMSEGKERKFRHRLFHILLSLYLDPNMDEQQCEEMVAPAVQLLNSELAEFDIAKVMQLIPSHWSVAIVDQFLNKALRSTLHRRYTQRIQCAMSRCLNLQIRFQKIHLENTQVVMTEDRICSVCKQSFVESAFARYPNGMIVHPQCSKHANLDSAKSYVFQKSDAR